MPVLVPGAVGAKILDDLAEQEIAAGRVSRARHPTGRVHGDETAGTHDGIGQERCESEKHGRGIAPRVGDEGCTVQRRAGELGQAVGNPIGGMARPKIRGQVDRARPCAARSRDPRTRRSVRKRAEDQLGALQRCVVGGDERQLASANSHAFATPFVRRGEMQVEKRVTGNEIAEFPAGISARAEDSNRNSMHLECILLHEEDVNSSASSNCTGAGALSDAYQSVRRMLWWWRVPGAQSVNKKTRQSLILEIIGSRSVASQEELRRLLGESGLTVTQSTLSRDLRELRLARIPTPHGVRYASPEVAGDGARAHLEDVLPQFFASAEGVGELLVVKTIPGGAQPIAEAIDAQSFADVLGTLGGENTILIICRSAAARERLERRIQKIASEQT